MGSLHPQGLERRADRNLIDRYNTLDGSSEPSYHSTMLVHPCNVLDCLSYCIQGNGEHIA
jgi:hypothetical protein